MNVLSNGRAFMDAADLDIMRSYGFTCSLHPSGQPTSNTVLEAAHRVMNID